MRNLFSNETTNIPNDFNVGEQESLIGLSFDETLKSSFKKHFLLNFWIWQQGKYPALSEKAVHFLLPYTTTYLYKKSFSALTMIKTKYRRSMNAESDLRLKLTSAEPDFARLCAQRQGHPLQ